MKPTCDFTAVYNGTKYEATTGSEFECDDDACTHFAALGLIADKEPEPEPKAKKPVKAKKEGTND